MKLRLPYLMALTLGALGVFYGTSTQGLNASPTADVMTIDHQVFELANSGTPKLVSFYSPDCPISQKDIVNLSALQKRYKDDNLDIIAVAMPYDSMDRISELKTQHDITYNLAHDADGTIAKAFPNVRFTPTTFLIDHEGTIIWRHTGSMKLDKINGKLEAALLNNQ